MIKRIESDILDSNIFIVEEDGDCIIIDAGVEPKKIENELANMNVLGVFLTHGHYDHSFYVLEYAKRFGCKIYGSGALREYLENPDYNYSEGKFSVKDFSKFEFLGDEGQLNLGKIKIKYKQLGGHSKSDMIYFIDEDVFVGDILIGRDMGRIDLYGGSKQEMKKSLQYLLAQDYKIMHSGHGKDNEKSAQEKVIKLWVKFLDRQS